MKHKLTLIILVLICGLEAQNSSLALSGLGERVQTFDPAATGLGNSQYFSGRAQGISLTALSSLWMSPFSRLHATSAFTLINGKNLPVLENQYLQDLSFTFPVGQQKAVAISLRPTTRADFYIQEALGSNPNINFGDQYYTSISHYHGEGGVSGLSVAYAAKIGENLSLGVQWTIDFGNLFKYDTLLTYSVTTDPLSGDVVYSNTAADVSIMQYTHRFHGHRLSLEGRFRLNDDQFVISSEIQPKLTITTTRSFGSIGDAPAEKYSKGLGIRSVGFGYSHALSKREGLTAEIHRLNDDDIPQNIALFNTLSGASTTLNMGIYRVFYNPRLSNWNTLNTRAGLFFTQRDKQSGNYFDYGITLGLGIDYIKSKNSVDLALVFGLRSSEFDEYSPERYASLVLGFTAGEKWFMNRKRK